MISFIMPIYNIKPEWIKRAVDSVINQTKNDWELLIVDDGSNKETGLAVDQAALADGRIRAFHQRNQGVSVARNLGLDNAKGEYIAFIDPDDWIELDYIEWVQGWLEKYDLEILAIGHSDQTEGGELRQLFGSKEFTLYEKEERTGMQLSILSDMEYAGKYPMFFGAPWKLLFKRDFINENKVSFVPGLLKAQDSVFCLYALENAEKIGYLNKVLYHYFWHPDSAVRKYTPRYDHIQKLLLEYKKFIEAYHNEQKVYWNALCFTSLTNFDGICERYFFNTNYTASRAEKKTNMCNLLSHSPYYELVRSADLSAQTLFKKMQLIAMKNQNYIILEVLYRVKHAKKCYIALNKK